MDKDKAIIVFQGKNLRRVWHNNQWYFVILDIVGVLTDSVNPSDYLKKIRKRDEALNEGWGQIVTPLRFETHGGPQNLNCVNTEGAFRLIQSIPSKKAEPFKRWLARVGYERVQEIENPELAQDRVKEYYELKGYPKDWIDKRLRGIAIRQGLTDEWKDRGVTQETEFAILTNEISKATFGKTVQEYKEFKGLKKKNQNLRDHMGDWELIFTMLGEKATTDITRTRDAQGFNKNKQAAQRGGQIAHNARKELEQETGESVLSKSNFLGLTDQKKLEKKNKADKK